MTEMVEANGLQFACLSEGTGPLVLLLHGFPDTAHTWDDLRPRLAAKGYRAVSPFLRGYHPTAIPALDADAETLAKDVVALIAALGATEAVVVGHDWGALAAYGAAALAPERVRQLFAAAIPHPAALRLTPQLAWRARHFFSFKLPGAARRFARHDFAALPEIYRRWSPTWHPAEAELAPVRACFSTPGSLDAAFGYYRQLKPKLSSLLKKKIEVPTVVFSGRDDPLMARADYAYAARRFTGSYVVEDLAGGHFMHREDPETFAALLLKHLAGS